MNEGLAGVPESRVEVRVLGPAEAVVDGRPVDLGAPKQRAVLALLASRHGEPMPVDTVLEELWDGNPPRSAKTSLQAYIANLRRVLEPDRPPRAPSTVLRTNSNGYLLDSRAVEIDVRLFGEHAAAGWEALDRGDPERALREFDAGLALWRGAAFSEAADAPSVVPEVVRLEELRLSASEGRCAALLAVGAHGVAVAELDGFVRSHPLREYGCELLSLALYRTGRQADALAVLRTNQNRLQEELGIDPRPALQDLERRILNQDPALDRSAPDTTAAAPPAAPAVAPAVDGNAFVGREAELRLLLDAQAAAAAGRGQVVTVTGELGIGKTALLRRFAEVAAVPVLWGVCPEHVTAPPLWAWEQVLRSVGTTFPELPVPGPVAELLGAGGRPPTDEHDDPATLPLFEAIVRYLTDASRAAPLAVVLDHLHRARPIALRLVAHLAESVPASRLLMLVSYRSGEAETATLAETTAALARTGTTRIELAGLTAAETQTFATTGLDPDVPRSTAEELHDRAAGNPLLLRELIKAVPAEEPVPATVQDVLLGRIAQLPETTALLLWVAAVAGRTFSIDTVAEAASLDIDTAKANLEPAISAGLIVEDPQRPGCFRFGHAVTAEVLYERTAQADRARIHRRIGEAAARVWSDNAERSARLAATWPLMFCRAARQ